MNRKMNNIEEVGYLEKGTGKHQSNVVYSAGGRSYVDSSIRNKNTSDDIRYDLCDGFAYCIDANYAKGITFEQFLKKHRRQLIIEQYRK